MSMSNGRKRWILFMLVMPAALSISRDARSAEPDSATTYYVSPDGRDAWSGSLPGTNPDKSDGPFATLQRARDEVRKRVAKGLESDVKVLVRAGTYHLARGLEFTPADSGTKDRRIVYAAYPGEVVTLVGGVKLEGFKPYEDGIVQAEIPEGLEPKQAFESGLRLELARTPNTGYLRLEKPAHTKTRSAFIYRANDLDPAGWDLAGAVVNIWPHHDWFNHNIAIEAVDPAQRRITLATGPRTINPGNRYYVKNVLALLDAPGECRIDLKRRRFYVRPRKSARDIVLSTAESVISIRGDGKGGPPVRNLHFVGLDISVCNGDAIRVSAAEDCSFRFCRIENAEQCGVVVKDHARRVGLYGCLIRYHGLHGVHLQGMGVGGPDVNTHHVVENCHIHRCGRLVGHGYGVRIFGSGHNRIVHNHIHHMPRYATTIKGVRFHAIRNKPAGMTFENRFDYYHSRNNRIAYNDIHDTNMDSQDTGAMESWGPGRDNVYDHNLIRGTGNDRFNIQSGMYLDDASDYFTVTNNIIYGVVGTGRNQPIYAKGIGNRFVNNILIVGPHCDSAIASFFMADERCDHHEYVRNIVYFAAPQIKQAAGRFGQGVGNIHGKGTTLMWTFDVPAAGVYDLWARYAAHNAPYKLKDMNGRFAVQVGSAAPVPWTNVPNTGAWDRQQWHRVASGLRLGAGRQDLTWLNLKGSGLNLDAMVFCDDPAWKPAGVEPPPPSKGKHLLTIHAETYVKKNGKPRSRGGRSIYHFQNWTPDRVTVCDYNLYYDSTGDSLRMSGQMPEKGKDYSYEAWRKALGGRFDKHSVVADPLFVDPKKHDYRLRPGSPALKLGFKPIDTSRIGLKDDFPGRFERE